MTDGRIARAATCTAVVLLAAAAGAFVVSATTKAPAPGGSTGSAAPSDTERAADPASSESSDLPHLRVSIPRLDLDEDLIELGIDADDRLEVPDDPARVGWFTGGSRPGESGATVLVGHLDSTAGPAVFARLPELAPGDEVVVTHQGETAVDYRVVAVEDVPKADFPTEAVYGPAGTDDLRLITCTGPWDADEEAHRDNRIVYAEAID